MRSRDGNNNNNNTFSEQPAKESSFEATIKVADASTSTGYDVSHHQYIMIEGNSNSCSDMLLFLLR